MLVLNKRARALSDASARRQLWSEYHNMSDSELEGAIRLYEFLITADAKRYRPANIQRVDLWYLRMVRTEIKRRKTREFCSSDYCADNDCRWLSE